MSFFTKLLIAAAILGANLMPARAQANDTLDSLFESDPPCLQCIEWVSRKSPPVDLRNFEDTPRCSDSCTTEKFDKALQLVDAAIRDYTVEMQERLRYFGTVDSRVAGIVHSLREIARSEARSGSAFERFYLAAAENYEQNGRMDGRALNGVYCKNGLPTLPGSPPIPCERSRDRALAFYGPKSPLHNRLAGMRETLLKYRNAIPAAKSNDKRQRAILDFFNEYAARRSAASEIHWATVFYQSSYEARIFSSTMDAHLSREFSIKPWIQLDPSCSYAASFLFHLPGGWNEVVGYEGGGRNPLSLFRDVKTIQGLLEGKNGKALTILCPEVSSKPRTFFAPDSNTLTIEVQRTVETSYNLFRPNFVFSEFSPHKSERVEFRISFGRDGLADILRKAYDPDSHGRL